MVASPLEAIHDTFGAQRQPAGQSQRHFKKSIFDETTVKYDALESKTVKNVSDVAIEHEYLYWTNNSHMDGHGGVHKAFTEPFIKAQPF